MGEFYYQTHHVLERHLKVGVKMSLDDMVNSLLSNILILKVPFQISSTETGVGVEVLRGPPLKVTTSVVNGGK